MNLTQPQGPLDEASQVDGDTFFLGVNERLSAMEPTPGLARGATNKRFRQRKAETRRGFPILPMGQGVDGLTPFNKPFGGLVFRDPVNIGEWVLIADLDGVWKCQPNNVALSVPLPAGVTLTADNWKRMLQCMGVLLMQRGPDNAQLVCTDLDEGFHAILQSSAGDGTDTIPNSSFGRYYSNRAFFIVGRDNVGQSDISDYTRYVEVVDTFKINEGEDDALVTIVPFGANGLIMGKERRIWKVLNVYGDLHNATGPHNVTQEYGVVGPDAMVEYDSLLYWFTGRELAVARLTETEETQAQTSNLSDDLQVSLARLNQRYAANVKLTTWRKNLYMAYPADDAQRLGDNLMSGSFSGGGSRTISGLTAGTQYYCVFGATTTTMDNGAVTYAYGRAGFYFLAAGASVVFWGPPSSPVGGVLYEVLDVGVNNAVAVFDFVNQQWSGVDESAALMVKQWLKFTYQGREQLTFIGHDGYLRGYELGFEDEQVSGGGIVPLPIEDELLTRGYPCQSPEGKRYAAFSALLSTFAPTYTITSKTDGVNRETAYASAQTRSRLAYDAPVGKADYDPSNDNGDADAPGRGDYAVVLDDAALGVNLGSGIALDYHQDSTHRAPVEERGHWMQLRIANTTGRCEIRAVVAEALERDRPSGVNL